MKQRVMKYGVVVFPGSNCDRDAIFAIEDVLKQEARVLWHKDSALGDVDCVIIPGGFSYGDYLRSGALARFSPIMGAVADFVARGGFALGICNGFQVLCEAGLLPGALRPNAQKRFVCKNTYLLPEVKSSLPTHTLNPTKPLQIPIAHGEGSYYADRETLASMRKHNQILFRYSNEEGVVRGEANPNGSVDNIAGICDRNHRVIGMMPHPERACNVEQGNTDGLEILTSIFSYWEQERAK